MTDLFDDIRSDLIKTKYLNIWQKYGKYALFSLATVIILILFIIIKHDYNKKNNIVATTNLFNLYNNYAVDGQRFLELYELMSNNSDTYHYELAQLKLAEYYLANKEIAKSYNLFYEIFVQENFDKVTKDFAELMLNYIIYYYPTSNDLDKNIISNIKTSNIFYNQIFEIRALGLVEQEKYEEAIIEVNKLLANNDLGVESKNFAINLLN
ncbi:MAG: hypothetical protein ACO2XZ_03675, partial [Rickettsiales bacterium]